MPYLYLLNGAPTFQPPGGGGNWTVNNLTVTGNETVGGTLQVSGGASFLSTLQLTGLFYSGAGVSPLSWYGVPGTSAAAMQIGGSTGIYNYTAAGNTQSRFYNNAYLDNAAADRYLINGQAVQIFLSTGDYTVRTAPIGVAGAVVTWTDALTVKNGGNVLIGTTTDLGYRLGINGPSDKQLILDVAAGGRYTSMYWANAGTIKVVAYWDNTTSGFQFGTNLAGSAMYLQSGGTTALTLDSSQNATFSGSAKIKNQATLSANGTVSVSTTPTTIYSALNTGSANWCWVFGDDGSSGFADFVVTVGGGGAVTVISSATVYGVPPLRTYSSSGANLRLSIALGTLAVRTASLNPGT